MRTQTAASLGQGGATIHFKAGVGRGRGIAQVLVQSMKQVPKDRCKLLKVLFVEECSLMRAAFLDLLGEVAKILKGSDSLFGGVRVILVGGPSWWGGEGVILVERAHPVWGSSWSGGYPGGGGGLHPGGGHGPRFHSWNLASNQMQMQAQSSTSSTAAASKLVTLPVEQGDNQLVALWPAAYSSFCPNEY